MRIWVFDSLDRPDFPASALLACEYYGLFTTTSAWFHHYQFKIDLALHYKIFVYLNLHIRDTLRGIACI